MLILTAGLAAIGLLPVAYSTSDWPKQSFFFAWGDTSIPFTIPTTTQCETINIRWQRGSATGPDPVAPYTLQILTSNYVTPFYINAGSSLSYDYTVPFAPGTQYQICMYDANGRTGGCQAMYTVIPASSTPSCTNVTFPASLEVDAKSSSGPLSQYGWPDQCTDISLTPKSGAPPFTFTAAPALHPPVNITSNSMAAINWTIDLSWGSPFFITLADSAGLMWSYGPLHSGGNGPTACLAKELTGVVSIGATVGSVIGAFVLGGILASVLFFLLARRRPKYGHNNPSLDLHSPKSSRELRPTPYITDMGTRVPYSPLGTRDDAYSTNNSRRPMIRTDSSFGMEPSPIGLASTGLQAEPFDPAAGSRRAASSTASPPTSPLDSQAQSQPGRSDTRSQVYVVHHDGGRAPVTIMTSDGAEVVELPPGYGSVPESSRARAVESQGRSGKGARQ